jgi:hypothetical protein
MWNHHENSDSDPDPPKHDVVERTPFGHMDQIMHLSDVVRTIDDHNMAEWDETKQRQADKMETDPFYVDAEDKKNIVPPLMKRFIKTFRDCPRGRGGRGDIKNIKGI